MVYHCTAPPRLREECVNWQVTWKSFPRKKESVNCSVLLLIQSTLYHQNFGLFSFRFIWSNHDLKINENCHPYLASLHAWIETTSLFTLTMHISRWPQFSCHWNHRCHSNWPCKLLAVQSFSLFSPNPAFFHLPNVLLICGFGLNLYDVLLQIYN